MTTGNRRQVVGKQITKDGWKTLWKRFDGGGGGTLKPCSGAPPRGDKCGGRQLPATDGIAPGRYTYFWRLSSRRGGPNGRTADHGARVRLPTRAAFRPQQKIHCDAFTTWETKWTEQMISVWTAGAGLTRARQSVHSGVRARRPRGEWDRGKPRAFHVRGHRRTGRRARRGRPRFLHAFISTLSR